MSFLDSVIVPKTAALVTAPPVASAAPASSFLASVATPASTASVTAPAKPTGSFLSTVQLPNAEQSKIADLQDQQPAYDASAKDANSAGTIAKETVEGVGDTVKNTVVDFAKSLWDTWSSMPGKLGADVQSGSDDYSKAINENPDTFSGGADILKGTVKAGLRTAGDAAIAIFAPISNAIGAILNNTGGQTLMNDAGQVIADKSGITDLPAFQKFAIDHPNAGDDFNRLTMLLMSGGADAKPEVEKQAADTAQTVVDDANKTPNTNGTGSVAPEVSPVAKPAAVAVPVPNAVKGGFLDTVQTPDAVAKNSIANSQALDVQGSINSGDILREQVYAKDNVVTPEFAQGRIDDIAQKLDNYKPGLGAKFKGSVDPTNVTMDGNVPEGLVKTASDLIDANKPEIKLPPRAIGITKTASDINQTLVKQGFDALTPEQQAKFTPGSYKQSADAVASLMDKDIETVKSMAKGDTPIPAGIHPEILFNAIEAYATKNGDAGLLRDLAASSVSKTSEAASTLGSHGYNDNPNSAVDTIRDIEKTKAGDKTVAKTRKLAQTEGNKVLLPKEETTWDNFLKSIQC